MSAPTLDVPRAVELAEPAEPEGVTVLRRSVVTRCRAWDVPGPIRFKVEVVASELLTNALEHGGVDVLVLRVERTETAVRLEVDDHNRDLPRLAPQNPASESGRGLRLVSELADRWGSTIGRVKTTYAEFDLYDPEGGL